MNRKLTIRDRFAVLDMSGYVVSWHQTRTAAHKAMLARSMADGCRYTVADRADIEPWQF